MSTQPAFPEDLTGSNPRNHITSETHDLTAFNNRVFIPTGGAFYTLSMVIVDNDTGNRLLPITDYVLLHFHMALAMKSGQGVCQAIYIKNPNITSVTLDYHVVGGVYSDTTDALRQLIANYNPDDDKYIPWGKVIDKPEVYPASAHRHSGHDFTDWSQVVFQLQGIQTALMHSDKQGLAAVYEYMKYYVNAKFDGSNSISKSQADIYYYSKSYIDQLHTSSQSAINDIVRNTTQQSQALGNRIDTLESQINNTPSTPTGVTQSQGDSRWAPKNDTATALANLASADNEIRTSISTLQRNLSSQISAATRLVSSLNIKTTTLRTDVDRANREVNRITSISTLARTNQIYDLTYQNTFTSDPSTDVGWNIQRVSQYGVMTKPRGPIGIRYGTDPQFNYVQCGVPQEFQDVVNGTHPYSELLKAEYYPPEIVLGWIYRTGSTHWMNVHDLLASCPPVEFEQYIGGTAINNPSASPHDHLRIYRGDASSGWTHGINIGDKKVIDTPTTKRYENVPVRINQYWVNVCFLFILRWR